MKKEDTFYYRQRTRGSGLPMDDVRKFAEEKKKEMKKEAEEKKKNAKKKGK